jgi:hypothetical protein
LGICAHVPSVNGTFYIGVIQVLTIITARPPFLAGGFLCHDFMFGAHPEGPDFIRKARFYHYFRFCTLSYFIILHDLFFGLFLGLPYFSKVTRTVSSVPSAVKVPKVSCNTKESTWCLVSVYWTWTWTLIDRVGVSERLARGRRLVPLIFTVRLLIQ